MAIMALLAMPSLAHTASVGGGSYPLSVTMYSNGSQVGYQLANLTAGSSETLNFSNNTKTTNITVEFITPTGAGIVANNQTYNLTIGSTVALVDPNSYTGYAYYAELTSISYPSITLLVYGQPPNQPATAAANATIIMTRNVTVQKQPITVLTTIIPASAPVVIVPTTFPSASNSNYLVVAIILIVLVLVLAYFSYSNANNSRKRGNKQ